MFDIWRINKKNCRGRYRANKTNRTNRWGSQKPWTILFYGLVSSVRANVKAGLEVGYTV